MSARDTTTTPDARVSRWLTRPLLLALVTMFTVAAAAFAAGLVLAADDDAGGQGSDVGAPHGTIDGDANDHAAMTGHNAPAPGGPNDLDHLLYPPKATPHAPGTVKEFTLIAEETDVEIAEGVTFPAWTFRTPDQERGTVPAPTIRVTEDDLVRITLKNASSHPHTIHTHGIHAASQDGVLETVAPGESFTYEFVAKPGKLQLYHCHAAPLKKHIHKGLYGMFIIDPKTPPEPAKELVMMMNGYDTDGNGENNFYTVNGKAFYYAKYPIKVKSGELVRIYIGNMTEFDLINSFHLHGNFFRYWPTGYGNPSQETDMITQAQGERGIIEVRFGAPGTYMFHAHQSEFADLGWMGFFEVEEGSN